MSGPREGACGSPHRPEDHQLLPWACGTPGWAWLPQGSASALLQLGQEGLMQDVTCQDLGTFPRTPICPGGSSQLAPAYPAFWAHGSPNPSVLPMLLL